FFFQAEDGIRDFHVTGVQTCALPISVATFAQKEELKSLKKIYAKEKPTTKDVESYKTALQSLESVASSEEEKVYKNFYKGMFPRSEERRVGKECRTRRTRKQKLQ